VGRTHQRGLKRRGRRSCPSVGWGRARCVGRVDKITEAEWCQRWQASAAWRRSAGMRRWRMRQRVSSMSASTGTASTSGDSFSGSVWGVAAEEARVWGLRLRPLLLPHAMCSASLWPWRWRPPHLLLAIEREGDISHSVCVILLNATRYK
jgi:hypothetical protein